MPNISNSMILNVIVLDHEGNSQREISHKQVFTDVAFKHQYKSKMTLQKIKIENSLEDIKGST